MLSLAGKVGQPSRNVVTSNALSRGNRINKEVARQMASLASVDAWRLRAPLRVSDPLTTPAAASLQGRLPFRWTYYSFRS
jgi:hypothetical protein